MVALIIVDIQNDFLPGGKLAVKHGDEIIALVNEVQKNYDLVIATQDWHPKNHESFVNQHKEKTVFQEIDLHGLKQTLWPVHCVQGTFGAEFSSELDMNKVSAIFRKGMNTEVDSYSGFYDNGKRESTGLLGFLKDKGVTAVDICGLAADFCVYYTANDALDLGFKTTILNNLTKPINNEGWESIKADFIKKGGELK